MRIRLTRELEFKKLACLVARVLRANHDGRAIVQNRGNRRLVSVTCITACTSHSCYCSTFDLPGANGVTRPRAESRTIASGEREVFCSRSPDALADVDRAIASGTHLMDADSGNPLRRGEHREDFAWTTAGAAPLHFFSTARR